MEQLTTLGKSERLCCTPCQHPVRDGRGCSFDHLPEALNGAFLLRAAPIPDEFKSRFLSSVTVGKAKGFRLGKNCAVRIRNLALHLGRVPCACPRGELHIRKAEL